MKITKSKLRQIIKEELEKSIADELRVTQKQLRVNPQTRLTSFGPGIRNIILKAKKQLEGHRATAAAEETLRAIETAEAKMSRQRLDTEAVLDIYDGLTAVINELP